MARVGRSSVSSLHELRTSRSVSARARARARWNGSRLRGAPPANPPAARAQATLGRPRRTARDRALPARGRALGASPAPQRGRRPRPLQGPQRRPLPRHGARRGRRARGSPQTRAPRAAGRGRAGQAARQRSRCSPCPGSSPPGPEASERDRAPGRIASPARLWARARAERGSTDPDRRARRGRRLSWHPSRPKATPS